MNRFHAAGLLALAALLSACGGGGTTTDTTTAQAADTATSADTAASAADAAAAAASAASAASAAEAAMRPTQPPQPQQPPPPAASRVAVGDKLFHDTSLSASGKLACASCHVPERGHADAQGVFLPLGGINMDQQGLRSSPTLRYLNANTAFTLDANGQPRGGFTWDGRANSRAAQARLPLLAANEMANADETAVATRLRATPYFRDLLTAYGLPSNPPDAQLVNTALQALQDYQQGDAEFQPFSSKFDAVQQGRATFTAQESHGFQLFNDPRRGNCASCHSSNPPPGGNRPLFTNFTYHALGVPRNHSQATADPAFFDMGLCGPNRTDLVGTRPDLCGRFKVPSLRNVALTAPYFHNGAIGTLEDAVAFYATRDTDPARWYPVVNGQVQRFNDLPQQYQRNVEQRPPFGQVPGQQPLLNRQDVADIVAFLQTLTDGWSPPR